MAILVQSNKKPSVSFPEQTGTIVTFDSQYAGLPLKSCVSQIQGYQEGSGTPSPSNVRNLVSFNSATLTENGNTYTFTFGQSIYQGYIDWKRGVVVGTHKIKSIDSSSQIYHGEGTNVFYINNFFDTAGDTKTTDCNYFVRVKQNYYTIANVQTYMEDKAFTCAISVNRLFIKNTDWSSLSDFLTWLGSGHIDIAIKLATPTTIQLPPCSIDTLKGVNNIWADTGDTTLQYIKIGG